MSKWKKFCFVDYDFIIEVSRPEEWDHLIGSLKWTDKEKSYIIRFLGKKPTTNQLLQSTLCNHLPSYCLSRDITHEFAELVDKKIPCFSILTRQDGTQSLKDFLIENKMSLPQIHWPQPELSNYRRQEPPNIPYIYTYENDCRPDRHYLRTSLQEDCDKLGFIY